MDSRTSQKHSGSYNTLQCALLSYVQISTDMLQHITFYIIKI